jgi:hypothetical protein
MFKIECDDGGLLDEFATYMETTLPVEIRRSEGRVLARFHSANLTDDVQRRVLERVAWAWRLEHHRKGFRPRFTQIDEQRSESFAEHQRRDK